ncbi:hypothetical protein A3K63_03645 [Candidatus Micrarchaeota archaeon RBG_16_49_10]|nr:MAG: hypothetical protein A3K63_03645 [Candidatus Micrarchaeota archaeon RBG_16_49_10]
MEPQRVNVYVENYRNGDDADYAISIDSVSGNCPGGGDCSHLIEVSMVSDKVLDLDEGEVGYTIATVFIEGPVRDGRIVFNVENGVETKQSEVNFQSSVPTSLPEFGNPGMIAILMIPFIALVVSYRLLGRF